MSDNQLFDKTIENYDAVSGGVWDALFTFIDHRDKMPCIELVFPKCFNTSLKVALINEHTNDAAKTLVKLVSDFNEKIKQNAVFTEKETMELFGHSLICRGNIQCAAELGNQIVELTESIGGCVYDCSFSDSYWDAEKNLDKGGLRCICDIANTKLWYIKKGVKQLEQALHEVLYTTVGSYQNVVSMATTINSEDVNQSVPEHEVLLEQLTNELVLRAVSSMFPAFESYWKKKIAALAEAHIQFKTPTLSGLLRGLALGLFNDTLADEIRVRLVSLVAILSGKKVIAYGIASASNAVRLMSWPLPEKIVEKHSQTEVGLTCFLNGCLTRGFRSHTYEYESDGHCSRRLVLTTYAFTDKIGEVVLVLD